MRHINYLVCNAWLAVLLAGSVLLAVGAESKPKSNASTVKNSGNAGMPRGELEDLRQLRKMLKDKTHPITWVITGDSITHGALHTHGWRSYPEHVAERVRWELQRYNDMVLNTGVTNDTTEILLGAWDARVARFKPDVVSIMEGMNDCLKGTASKEEFAKNLGESIGKARKIGAIPVLHTMNTINGGADQQRKALPEYVEVIRNVAHREKVILVDNYAYWLAERSTIAASQEWRNDAIHPNEIGHRALAHEMFRTLECFDGKSPTCSLPLGKDG